MMIRQLAFITIAAAAAAQTPTMKCNDNSDENNRHCEIREQTIAYPGQLTIDGRQNGGVQVKGWSRGDVLVRMKLEARASSDAEAKNVVNQIRVNTGAGKIAADGPSTQGEGGWSVSYEVFVPHQANLDLIAQNGGIHISDIQGNVKFSTVNGGAHLDHVDGYVTGKTVNGGLHIELAGNSWNGQGMDVSTTNGGVHLALPAGYNAHLETSTSNGGLHADYPMTVTGKIGKQLSTNLGGGGAPIKVTTTNGGVHISKI
jgi:DUF4097 and DUF4098 domain-containing protein YvlB